MLQHPRMFAHYQLTPFLNQTKFHSWQASTEVALTQILGADGSVGGATGMDRLIEVAWHVDSCPFPRQSTLRSRHTRPCCSVQITDSDTLLPPTEQAMVLAALMATKDRDLLTRFSHSSALERVHEWLQETLASPAQPESTMALLLLLSHLPMTINSLSSSGVGRTVNKLRKSSDVGIQNGASNLLKSWKAIASAEQAPSQPAVVAATPDGAAAKRSLEEKPASIPPVEKRHKPVSEPSHDMSDESSLDSALSAESTRRKASLKPDHLKPRRPAQSISLSLPTSQLGRHGSCRGATSPMLHNISGANDRPSPRMAEPPVALASARVRRVQWAAPSAMTEIREYVIEDKQRPSSGFKDQVAVEVEREKTMLQQRHTQNNTVEKKPISASLLDLMRPSSASTANVSPGTQANASAIDKAPQPTRPWATPPLLPESLWPAVKGDASTEREVRTYH